MPQRDRHHKIGAGCNGGEQMAVVAVRLDKSDIKTYGRRLQKWHQVEHGGNTFAVES